MPPSATDTQVLALCHAAPAALWRGSDLVHSHQPGIPTGFSLLDAELPGGGWPAACLIELLPACEGIGELRLLGPALARLQSARKLAWIAPPYPPYAPALTAAGIAPPQLMVVHARNGQEALWAADQALRSGACSAVLLWSDTHETAALRRLQLAAAENASTLAFLFRPPAMHDAASPAALRLALAGTCDGLEIRILKRRGAPLHRRLLIPALTAAERNHPPSSHYHALDRPTSAAIAAGHLSSRRAYA